MSCKNNSSNSSSESPISTLAAILKRLYSRPQSTASHLFARTRSFHRPVSFRPATDDVAARALATHEGYKMLDHPRVSRSTGGGTGLLFRDTLCVSKLSAGEKSSFELSEWLVTSGSYRLRAVIIYRVPYSAVHSVSTNAFFAEFSDYMESIILAPEKLVIMGDFNIHVDVAGDKDASKLQDLFESLGLQQHVKGATHIHGHTLDLIVTRQSQSVISMPQVDRLFSDHFAVTCGLQMPKPATSVKKHNYRNLKAVNIDQLRKDLSDSELCTNPPSSLDVMIGCYNTTLTDILNCHAPLKTRTVTVRRRLPWFNEDIREAKRARRRAEKRWRRTRSSSDFECYKKCRNRVTYLLNNARTAFYKDFIEENSGDQGKLFRATKRLLGQDSGVQFPPHDDEYLLANAMGNFFVKKVSDIRLDLDVAARGSSGSSKNDFDRPVRESVSEFKLLNDDDVLQLVKKCAMKHCALDPMPTPLVAECMDVLLPVIKQMINQSLETASFPDSWKEAIVNPLLKRHGLDLLYKNYRPVSNLSYVSKLTERSVLDQLLLHMSSNGLYPVLQSSYRQHHSTETALFKVKNDILMNMNKGHVTLLVL